MLSRVDTKQYVLDLENKLSDLGVDVRDLQSSYDYKKNSFAAEVWKSMERKKTMSLFKILLYVNQKVVEYVGSMVPLFI